MTVLPAVQRPVAGHRHTLRLRRLGIDTQQDMVVYMRPDCHVCRSEGFSAQARILVEANGRTIVATLGRIAGDLLSSSEASLSENAWQRLTVNEGDEIALSHAPPLDSLSFVRGKVYGQRLEEGAWHAIIDDIARGRYTDVHLSSFITACAGRSLDLGEIVGLTRAMVAAGERLDWGRHPIADKHSVGGLPGNRTTPIIVAIAASLGLTIPKTSSRAITSPAGTADTMETLAPVDLDVSRMRRVVDREGGCIVWGGAVDLSPADDVLVRVERSLDLDGEGQLVASVLSKKIAAGATHLVLDMPVGATAKVRTVDEADRLAGLFTEVASAFGIRAHTLTGDGSQPIGRGIGPALEARDILSVLRGEPDAPLDLRQRALLLAGSLLEMVGGVEAGQGAMAAARVLDDGSAWRKFQAICQAQGGMRKPPRAPHTRPVIAARAGRVAGFDNRVLARVAKLSGAPNVKEAGIELHVHVGDLVQAGQPVYTVHSAATGELAYALDYAAAHPDVIRIDPA
jgi:thymidine phosphorylase